MILKNNVNSYLKLNYNLRYSRIIKCLMQRIFLNTSKKQFEVKLGCSGQQLDTVNSVAVFRNNSYWKLKIKSENSSNVCICSETTANIKITVKWMVKKGGAV